MNERPSLKLRWMGAHYRLLGWWARLEISCRHVQPRPRGEQLASWCLISLRANYKSVYIFYIHSVCLHSNLPRAHCISRAYATTYNYKEQGKLRWVWRWWWWWYLLNSSSEQWQVTLTDKTESDFHRLPIFVLFGVMHFFKSPCTRHKIS